MVNLKLSLCCRELTNKLKVVSVTHDSLSKTADRTDCVWCFKRNVQGKLRNKTSSF